MSKRKGRWVTTEDWTCGLCEGAGSAQWVEGLGEPQECPSCKGEGYRKAAYWEDDAEVRR